MNEAEIAADLASKIPSKEPELNPPYPEPDKPEETRPTYSNDLPLESSQLNAELNDYFNLGVGAKHNSETQSQLNEILTWLKSNAETPDLPGILRTLRHTEVILGTFAKPDRMARIYRYVRIQQQKALIAERERSLYV